jgi:hypothetical protein
LACILGNIVLWYECLYLSPTNSYIEILTLKVMVSKSGEVIRSWGQRFPYKSSPRELVCSLSLYEVTRKRWFPCRTGPLQTLNPPVPWSWT